uniref:Uncharacterized protein n=1 Tax=Avena sativa TaxID=4498 RepID=A0ACD5TBL4_AVESA
MFSCYSLYFVLIKLLQHGVIIHTFVRHMRLKTGPSSNGSLLSIDARPVNSEIIDHLAIYKSMPFFATKFYGAMATLDIFETLGPKEGQISAEIWVANYQEGHHDKPNLIQAGWSIAPSYYGENRTHFVVGWTADGYDSTGCFDLKCTGFVPVNYAPITPGDTLDVKSKITIKIFKSKDDGDWWLHFARGGKNLAPVGFWPKSLFNTLDSYADHIQWGGYTSSLLGNPSPPMGNGHWPSEYSATFQDLQYINEDGMVYPPIPEHGIQSYVSHKECYQVSRFMTNKFSYGGPGGCTN